MKVMKRAAYEALMMAQQWGPLLEEHHGAAMSCEAALAAAHQDAGEARAEAREAREQRDGLVGQLNAAVVREADATRRLEAELLKATERADMAETQLRAQRAATADPQAAAAAEKRLNDLIAAVEKTEAALYARDRELVRVAAERDSWQAEAERLRREMPEQPADGESTRGEEQ